MYSPPSSITAAIAREAAVSFLPGLCLRPEPNPIAPQTRYDTSRPRMGISVNARMNTRRINSSPLRML